MQTTKEQSGIKEGDEILIKDNLAIEMERLKFIPSAVSKMVKTFKGTKQKALTIWKDDEQAKDEWFVTVDLFCEIPIRCCEVIPSNIIRPKDGNELLQALKENKPCEVVDSHAFLSAKILNDNNCGFSFSFKKSKWNRGWAGFTALARIL